MSTTSPISTGSRRVEPSIRFWPKVDISGGPDACWLWTGFRDHNGYGRFWGPHLVKAHRISWEFANGPIPDGMLVCHKCDNPPCVNPAHLFLGTTKDNGEDMARKGRIGGSARTNAAKTHCKRGHEFTAANTYVAKAGSRVCRQCGAALHRARKIASVASKAFPNLLSKSL